LGYFPYFPRWAVVFWRQFKYGLGACFRKMAARLFPKNTAGRLFPRDLFVIDIAEIAGKALAMARSPRQDSVDITTRFRQNSAAKKTARRTGALRQEVKLRLFSQKHPE
jgi:hypothetical protein